MISGNLPFLLSVLWMATSAPTQAPVTDALLSRLARPAPARTAFVEVRFSDLLTKPLVSRGELSFEAADHLGKRVDQPFSETTTVRGESVRIERKGRKAMQFSLKRAPELRALLVGFSGLLAGDAAKLRRHFAILVSGDTAHWQIELTPEDARMRKRINGLTVFGGGDVPRCFQVDLADGDASVMLVDAAAVDYPQPPSLPTLIAHCEGKVD